MFKGSNATLLYLGNLGGITSNKPAHAGLCNGCGRCARACPQKLDIPIILKDVSKQMEGRGFNYKVKLGKSVIFPIFNGVLALNTRISRLRN
jgi:hypothetical protein